MKKSTKNLLERIDELEARVAELEARPTVTYVLQPPPQPVLPNPAYPNIPWQPPPTITFGGDSVTADNTVHEVNPGVFLNEEELVWQSVDELHAPGCGGSLPDSAGPRGHTTGARPDGVARDSRNVLDNDSAQTGRSGWTEPLRRG